MNERFYGIKKDEVELLSKHCQSCLLERQNRSRAPLEPIISDHTLQQVQIDLVDFRHEPDGQYKWVLHIEDHFSKWTSLFALKSKSAAEVADAHAMFIGFFGHPEIIQCDNGREFKGVLLVLLKQYGIKVINGRPRTPLTQGLGEQANGPMKSKIRTMKADLERAGYDLKRWATVLPRIALSMN
jgi:hypothetical protein